MGWEPGETTTHYDADGNVTGYSVTTREPEFSVRDQALLLADWDERQKPRGPHGIPLDQATDPANNPLSPSATGRFVAEPVADFAQDAIDKAREARRKAIGDGDDWPLIWRARWEPSGVPVAGEQDEADDGHEGADA